MQKTHSTFHRAQVEMLYHCLSLGCNEISIVLAEETVVPRFISQNILFKMLYGLHRVSCIEAYLRTELNFSHFRTSCMFYAAMSLTLSMKGSFRGRKASPWTPSLSIPFVQSWEKTIRCTQIGILENCPAPTFNIVHTDEFLLQCNCVSMLIIVHIVLFAQLCTVHEVHNVC